MGMIIEPTNFAQVLKTATADLKVGTELVLLGNGNPGYVDPQDVTPGMRAHKPLWHFIDLPGDSIFHAEVGGRPPIYKRGESALGRTAMWSRGDDLSSEYCRGMRVLDRAVGQVETELGDIENVRKLDGTNANLFGQNLIALAAQREAAVADGMERNQNHIGAALANFRSAVFYSSSLISLSPDTAARFINSAASMVEAGEPFMGAIVADMAVDQQYYALEHLSLSEAAERTLRRNISDTHVVAANLWEKAVVKIGHEWATDAGEFALRGMWHARHKGDMGLMINLARHGVDAMPHIPRGEYEKVSFAKDLIRLSLWMSNGKFPYWPEIAGRLGRAAALSAMLISESGRDGVYIMENVESGKAVGQIKERDVHNLIVLASAANLFPKTDVTTDDMK